MSTWTPLHIYHFLYLQSLLYLRPFSWHYFLSSWASFTKSSFCDYLIVVKGFSFHSSENIIVSWCFLERQNCRMVLFPWNFEGSLALPLSSMAAGQQLVASLIVISQSAVVLFSGLLFKASSSLGPAVGWGYSKDMVKGMNLLTSPAWDSLDLLNWMAGVSLIQRNFYPVSCLSFIFSIFLELWPGLY